MADWIYDYFPKDIKTYSEPFSGAMWVYTSPKLDYTNVKRVIYNDYNKHMANLFSCLKEHKKYLTYLENEIDNGFLKTDKTGQEYKDFYRDIFYSYKNDKSDTNFLDNPTSNFPDFDAAVKYTFLLTSTFNGVFPRGGGFSGVGKNNKIKLYSLINKLKKKEYQNKLSNITNVHSLDFEELINMYDEEDTFFYLDPPYFSPGKDGKDTGKRANWYGVKDSFNYETHMRLLNLLKTTKSRWALSYYYFPELEEHLPKDKYFWYSKDFFRTSANFADSEQQMGTEILILNYDPNEQKTKIVEKELSIEESKFFEESTVKFVSEQIELEPEFNKFINDNISDLLYDEKIIKKDETTETTETDDDFWES